MSTNRVDDEDDVNALNELLIRANITSDKGKYEEIMNKVITFVKQLPSLNDAYVGFSCLQTVQK